MMQPTRTRYRATGFLFLLAALTYLDRVCISVLAPDITRSLNLTKVQMSFVFSAFAIAYARPDNGAVVHALRIGPHAGPGSTSGGGR